jgi:phosphoribosylformylglycinamidine synthase
MNAFRIEIENTVQDNRAGSYQAKIQAAGFPITRLATTDVYTVVRKFKPAEQEQVGEMLTNSVYESFNVDEPDVYRDFDWAVEIGFLPGVTDNVGATVVESIENKFNISFNRPHENVYGSVVLYVFGKLTEEQARQIGRLFANPLIQRITVKSQEDFQNDGGMDIFVPEVKLREPAKPMEVNLEVSDEELVLLGKKGIAGPDGVRRGPLALSLLYLKTIRDYFRSEERNPYDIELESIAQTWSEHCRHTIFANPVNEYDGGIFKTFIRQATVDIRKQKGKDDFCVSVFSDNSGGIDFDDEWVVTDKMETHNSPSALDPLGGAMTGIVGVNRDCIGYGRGAKPVMNRYGFCTADPRKTFDLYRGRKKSNPILQPREILDGVVGGVNEGGNQSGIPTPLGFTYFDDGYVGKPLVFAGTIGLIPRKLDGRDSSEKSAKAGDAIIVVGGRVGMDGIHGATFSSEALDEGSPATAVQIGDPITQKKLSDAVMYDLREGGFINSVHDCGAGGISGTIGELGDEAGGFEVHLERVPLKYQNLEPWQIWISESQERMTFSVPQEKVERFVAIFKKHGVEATVLGKFTDSGRGQIFWNGAKIFDLSLNFLATGWPREQLKAEWKQKEQKAVSPPTSRGGNDDGEILEMLRRPNITSNQWISQQYDHEVLGGSVIKPFQGAGRVNGSAAVTRPVLSSNKAVVTSHALNPRMTNMNPYAMAAATIDDAVGSAVAAGANVDHMAIMDNFCWCSSDEISRMGQLLETAKACYDVATVYGTPYISGKDSMFNDFRGFDADDKEVKISVPPTLLISTLGVIPDATKVQTIDWKMAGDKIFVIGETKAEFGGSEFRNMKGLNDSAVPVLNAEKAKSRYVRMFSAHQKGLLASSQHVWQGGLATALAKSCIAAQMGAHVDLNKISEDLATAMWSESKSRFLVSIASEKVSEFEKLFPEAVEIGEVAGSDLVIAGVEAVSVEKMAEAYFDTFKSF